MWTSKVHISVVLFKIQNPIFWHVNVFLANNWESPIILAKSFFFCDVITSNSVRCVTVHLITVTYQLWVNFGIKTGISDEVDNPSFSLLWGHVQFLSQHAARKGKDNTLIWWINILAYSILVQQYNNFYGSSSEQVKGSISLLSWMVILWFLLNMSQKFLN